MGRGPRDWVGLSLARTIGHIGSTHRGIGGRVPTPGGVRPSGSEGVGALEDEADVVNRTLSRPVQSSVVSVGADDETLLRALLDEHGRALLGYATRLTGDRVLAEDVVQETLLRAWRHAGSLDPTRGSLRPWLFTVARHVVIDLMRARGARPPESGGDALAAVPVADDIERAVETWTVAAALESLSPEHRAVLIETYYRGLSVAQAAERLGIPPGTVKSRAFYALRELRLRLQEKGVMA